MDGLLTPIRITSLKTSNTEEPPLDLKLSSKTLIRPRDEAASVAATSSPSSTRKPTSPDNALEILRLQPSLAELSTVLTYLLSPPQPTSTTDREPSSHGSKYPVTFDIKSISPLTSRIANTFIVDIIPAFWGILTSSSRKTDRNRLLQCLQSISGLSGIVERLRLLLKQAPSSGQPKNVTITKVDVEGAGKREGVLAQVGDLMDVLGHLLRGNRFLGTFWEGLRYDSSTGKVEDRKREMTWKEFVGLIAGGKLLSVAAEADIALSEAGDALEGRKSSWVGDGKEYSSWLRENIANMLDEISKDDVPTWKAISSILARGFGLGYNDHLIDIRYCLRPSLLTDDFFDRTRILLSHLKEHEKRTYINTLLKLLSQKYLAKYLEEDQNYDKRVNLVAKIIHEICIVKDGLQQGYQEILIDWILVDGGPGAGEPIGIRRAIISAIRVSPDSTRILRECLDSQVQTFGESLWVRHAPIIHQEVNVQCLLLCAGYVHRQPPAYLKLLARSSPFMNGISNHLASTNIRVRFLGMIVGETISILVDKDGKQLRFTDSLDGTEEEADSWRDLAKIEDNLPGLEIFKDESIVSQSIKKFRAKAPLTTNKAPQAEIPIAQNPTIIDLPLSNRIRELNSDSEGDDLVPYPKPDSDPEDSDDDATLVNRGKPTPPVYIRDLLYMLNDLESYDKQQMALQHAALLIRRKATFGTELSSHAVDLLTALTGLQDKFDMPNFDNLRLKAVVALTVTLPLLAGPWISERIFEGEYSLAQRCVMLSAVGLAAMELSGEQVPEDSPLFQFQLSSAEQERSQFPSKRLPRRLHDIYASTPVDTLSNRLKSSILQPIAAKAADELTPGPSLIKVRKFSTRIEVEAGRKKPGVNKLSQVVVPAFFGPLTGRWWVFVKDYGGNSDRLVPHLLSLYVKTLTVLLHATGPNGVLLPQMIDGFWDLLLSLRHNPITLENSTVLDGVLIGFLTLFEVCKEDRDRRRMAEERSKELVETQEWVSRVFEGSDGSEGTGEERKGLAAAVLLRCRDVVERYERLLMGELIG
ncbi:hypothetical protein H072_1336 [Dactylellina haptotyla CBS 200.50]|uniref:Telomere length regulation protein conserved domain-containing protein n=1 Tax=Dactylellina haptotyla (strain CBS 200.50) TaxID=1284197 RepID=S8ANZ0_DACHA|nr:hypothetical protein H072_1336 [Dactylellina haptotyla CBS 200.50]